MNDKHARSSALSQRIDNELCFLILEFLCKPVCSSLVLFYETSDDEGHQEVQTHQHAKDVKDHEERARCPELGSGFRVQGLGTLRRLDGGAR